MFHSYGSLPEGNLLFDHQTWGLQGTDSLEENLRERNQQQTKMDCRPTDGLVWLVIGAKSSSLQGIKLEPVELSEWFRTIVDMFL